jgi:galactonate dehydratase
MRPNGFCMAPDEPLRLNLFACRADLSPASGRQRQLFLSQRLRQWFSHERESPFRDIRSTGMNTAVAIRRSRLRAGFAPQAAVANPKSADHSVAEMRWFPVREPVSGNRYTVLRVKTQSGLIGWGECAQAPEQDAKTLAEKWIRKPATLYAAIDWFSPLAGALDMALLDILGKACRAPVYRVLGGPTRHKVRAFSRSNIAGFSAVDIQAPKPASRNQGKAYENQVQALLKQLPEDRDFVLSAHGSLTPSDAASVAQAIGSYHPLWFDEPCSASNLETVRKVSGETVTPLGFGRGVADPGAFLALLREGLVDVVRPDIAQWGITGARRIAIMAEAYYVAIAPNHDGGPIATAAALHLAASVPNFFIQHVPLPDAPEDRAMRAAIAPAGLETPQDGFLQLPIGPGLGIEVSEAALEKYGAA